MLPAVCYTPSLSATTFIGEAFASFEAGEGAAGDSAAEFKPEAEAEEDEAEGEVSDMAPRLADIAAIAAALAPLPLATEASGEADTAVRLGVDGGFTLSIIAAADAEAAPKQMTDNPGEQARRCPRLLRLSLQRRLSSRPPITTKQRLPAGAAMRSTTSGRQQTKLRRTQRGEDRNRRRLSRGEFLNELGS
jgi:hypothetical protein